MSINRPHKKYLPKSEKHPTSQCVDDKCTTITHPCQNKCDEFTYFFHTPVTLYTYYEYPIINHPSCTKACPYPSEEINYKIYQIIDGLEYYVGDWLIKNKDTPNKKEFKECGDYVLRFCSSPPSECYPDCRYHNVPIIYQSSCNCEPIIERRSICVKYLNNIYYAYQINCVSNHITTPLRLEWIDYMTIPSHLTIEVSHMCDCDILYINPLG